MSRLFLQLQFFLEDHQTAVSLMSSIIFGTVFGLGAAYLGLAREWLYLAVALFPPIITAAQLARRRATDKANPDKDLSDTLLLIAFAVSAVIFIAFNALMLFLERG